MAYAVADKLGFAKDKVTWIVVPFTTRSRRAPRPSTSYINQVSYKPERAEAVDLSDGYYNLNQARRRAEGQPGREGEDAGGPEGLTSSAPRSARRATTPSQKVIVPTTEAAVYDTNDAAVEALKAKQIDGLVVDLPTADFIRHRPDRERRRHHRRPVRADRGRRRALQHGPREGQRADRVRQRAPSAGCSDDGELDTLAQEWLADKANAPVFQPCTARRDGALDGGPPAVGRARSSRPGARGPRPGSATSRLVALARRSRRSSTVVVFGVLALGHRQLARLARVPGVLPQRRDLLGRRCPT